MRCGHIGLKTQRIGFTTAQIASRPKLNSLGIPGFRKQHCFAADWNKRFKLSFAPARLNKACPAEMCLLFYMKNSQAKY